MRFVIKIGTSLVTDKSHRLDEVFLGSLVSQVANIKKRGHEVVIVSSGAVASGRSEVSFEKERKNIPFRQALAAVGQGILMKNYHDLFEKSGIVVAQALLTNYDFSHRENFLNTKNVFELLLGNGVVPIVNENDVTSMAELKFGDNDMLSAKTAVMIGADFLLILSDVDGLFLENPQRNPDAKLVEIVEKIDDSTKSLAQGPVSAHSKGGMVTKIEAAQYATTEGVNMFIANGRQKNVIENLVRFCEEKEKMPRCTFFKSSKKGLVGYKKWLRPKIKKDAWILVDDGAEHAIKADGKSLLPSGIAKVHGQFLRGDVVQVRSSSGEIAYGQTNYGADDVDKIKKHRSNEIEQLLGFSFEEEVIHRDRMVVL